MFTDGIGVVLGTMVRVLAAHSSRVNEVAGVLTDEDNRHWPL